MQPHPSLSPYLASDGVETVLIVPVWDGVAATVWRIPIPPRRARRMLVDLANFLYDQTNTQNMGQTHDIEAVSHDGFLEELEKQGI